MCYLTNNAIVVLIWLNNDINFISADGFKQGWKKKDKKYK